MGFHNNYLGFFKCFTGWPADTNNNQTTPPLSPCAWFQHGRETARRSRCTSSLPVSTTTPNSSRGDGILQIRIQTHVAIGIHWYPRDWDLQILVTWYQSTPRNYSNWIQEERKKKSSSQHVWCSACWTCGPPEAWQMLSWGIYVPFCFSMKVNLHLYVHFIILYILSWDGRMFHAITWVQKVASSIPSRSLSAPFPHQLQYL